MSKDHRIKMANSIRDALIELKIQRNRSLIEQTKNCKIDLEIFTELFSKFEKACNKNLHLAANKLYLRIRSDIDSLFHSINKIKTSFSSSQENIPDIKTIFEEVSALASVFETDLVIDYAKNTLSINTEPIEFDELYLGEFSIVLNISELPKMNCLSPYSIIALDPNPSATNEDITHPHVSCEKLCEGDGTVPIRKALAQGRLTDFFTIIKNILDTYNPDSPYVAIDEWCGIACYDCGYTTDRENLYYCYHCDRDYCEECSSYCRCCDETTCLGCGGECPSCGEFICKSCLTECQNCKTQMCKGCIEENDLCLECKTELEDLENNENEEQEYCKPVVAEIQSYSVGQVNLLQGH